MTPSTQPVPTANDRLKGSESARFWGALVVATLVHALVFAMWPDMRTDALAAARDATEVIRLPQVEIPPPPEALPRPLGPIVASTDISVDVVPEVPRWRDVPDLPPPPVDTGVSDAAADRRFVPYTLAPRILNPDQVRRALEREYPATLRDAGLGGTVYVLFHVGENGEVLQAEVDASSGFEALDAAALRVADAMRLSPARNRDRVVAVWIRMPIVFQVR